RPHAQGDQLLADPRGVGLADGHAGKVELPHDLLRRIALWVLQDSQEMSAAGGPGDVGKRTGVVPDDIPVEIRSDLLTVNRRLQDDAFINARAIMRLYDVLPGESLPRICGRYRQNGPPFYR